MGKENLEDLTKEEIKCPRCNTPGSVRLFDENNHIRIYICRSCMKIIKIYKKDFGRFK